MKIAIVGAGLMGRLTALKLIEQGHQLTLLEANSFDQPHNAAAISAGLVAPISESIHTSQRMVQLGQRSQPMWPKTLQLLKELDPEHQQVAYCNNGTLAISFPEEQECLFNHQKRLQSAMPDCQKDIQLLYNDEVAAVEPELGRFESALHIHNESNLCNAQFLAASSRAIRKHASIIDHWALQGDGSELQRQYDWVIDCRGAGAVNAKTHAEADQPLIAVRGEAIRVHTPAVKLTRPVRVIKQRFTIFIVPKADNIFVVGATDLDKQATKAVTVRSSLDLLSSVYALHPGFADAEIIEAVAGQRALYPNKEPCIQQVENIVSINGLARQGWMVGPALLDELMHTIQ